MSEINNTTQTLESLDRYIQQTVERVMPPEAPKRWELDKRIPLSLIVTMCLQLVAFAWYAAKMDSRIEKTEEKIIAQQLELSKRGDWMASTNDRIVRMETTLTNVNEVLRDVKTILEKRR